MWNPRERVFTSAALISSAVDMTALKTHLRVTGNDDDLTIWSIGIAATQMVEVYTQRLLVSRACVLEMPEAPSAMCEIELPGGAVSAVVVTVDGVTFSGASYQVKGQSPARLIPLVEWPVAANEGMAVNIAYTAGYSQVTVPPGLRHAVLVIAADLYDTRQSLVAGSMSNAAFAAQALMDPFRISPIA